MQESNTRDRREFLKTALGGSLIAAASPLLRPEADKNPITARFPVAPTPAPIYSYPAGSSLIRVLHSSARYIGYQGRRGLMFTSIHGRAAIPQHSVNARKGTLAFWVLPLQEISPEAHHPNHTLSNPFYNTFAFLTDREAIEDVQAANFCVFQTTDWYPGLTAKFVNTDGARWGQAIAQATANYFEFLPNNWYQISLTWDRENGDYRVYANGILVAASDTFVKSPPAEDPSGPILFFGSPGYAMGQVDFFDQLLSPTEIGSLFVKDGGRTDTDIQSTLEMRYTGDHLVPLSTPGVNQGRWTQSKKLSLRDPREDAEFFQQGCETCLRFTDEGLRITTPSLQEFLKKDGRSKYDMTRMYLWTRETFEGDLYVSAEFKIHQHGGLALWMFQAAGMQGEDFLNDYPLRSDGSMRVVTSEDIRNYHWEFYREMFDTRNDLVSHAVVKNPWAYPIAFQVENRRWDLDRWYRVSFLQEERRLRGAIDGVKIFDVTDSGVTNNGPVMRQGRVALRVMMRSDLTFRDLEIWTRTDYE
jgi:hypothetical protein